MVLNNPIRWMCVAALAAGTGWLESGCANMGYSLGSMLPPDIKTVYVPTVINRTDEPLVDIEVTRAVIEQIQLDGSLKVAGEDDADSVLHIVLTKYQIVPISFEKVRRTAAEEYRIYLTAQVRLTRTADGETVVENPLIQGEATFELQGDLTSSKRIGLPEAANDLGHDIVEQIVEHW